MFQRRLTRNSASLNACKTLTAVIICDKEMALYALVKIRPVFMFLKGSSIIDQYWGIEIESFNLNADNAQI